MTFTRRVDVLAILITSIAATVLHIDEVIDHDDCVSFGPFDANLYDVSYSMRTTIPIDTFSVIFTYLGPFDNTTGCNVRDYVTEITAIRMNGEVEWGDHFVLFESIYWVVIRNDMDDNSMGINGTVNLEVSWANPVVQDWPYFVTGLVILIALCCSICGCRKWIAHRRQKSKGIITMDGW